MEEVELRALIEDVRAERLPRRRFIERMVGLGLTAPMASMLLMHAGIAQSQPMPVYKPTKRGGGGALKVLFWQARRCCSRTSPTAPRTRKARASSTSRSPSGTTTATSFRSSPPRSRPAQNGGVWKAARSCAGA